MGRWTRCSPGPGPTRAPSTLGTFLRKNRGSRGGRPVDFDAADYKDRNVVERAFNKLKNWRGLATRYDKHALIYRGGMVLASIVLWLNA